MKAAFFRATALAARRAGKLRNGQRNDLLHLYLDGPGQRFTYQRSEP